MPMEDTTNFISANQENKTSLLPITNTDLPGFSKVQDKLLYTGTNTTNTDGSSVKPIPPMLIFLTVAYSVAFSFFSSFASVIGHYPTILVAFQKLSFSQECAPSQSYSIHGLKLSFVEKFVFQVVLIIACLFGKELKYRGKCFAFCLGLSSVATLVLVGNTNIYYQTLATSKHLDCNILKLANTWIPTAAVWLVLIGNVFITSQMMFYAIRCLLVCRIRLFFYWLIWEMFLDLFIRDFMLYICPSLSVSTLSGILIGCCFLYSLVTVAIVRATNRFSVPENPPNSRLYDSSDESSAPSAKAAVPSTLSDGHKPWSDSTINTCKFLSIIIFTIYFCVYLPFYIWNTSLLDTSAGFSGQVNDSFYNVVLNSTHSPTFYILSVTELLFLLFPCIEGAIGNTCNPVKVLLVTYCVVTAASFMNIFIPVSSTITTYVSLWVFFYTFPLFIVQLSIHCCTFSGFLKQQQQGSKACLYTLRSLSFLTGILLLVPLLPFLFSQPYTYTYTHWLILAGTVGCVVMYKFYEPSLIT